MPKMWSTIIVTGEPPDLLGDVSPLTGPDHGGLSGRLTTRGELTVSCFRGDVT